MTLDVFDLMSLGPPLVLLGVAVMGAWDDHAAGRRRTAAVGAAGAVIAAALYLASALGASWWLLLGAFVVINLAAGVVSRSGRVALVGLVWAIFPLWFIAPLLLAPLAVSLLAAGVALGHALVGAEPRAPAWGAAPERP